MFGTLESFDMPRYLNGFKVKEWSAYITWISPFLESDSANYVKPLRPLS